MGVGFWWRQSGFGTEFTHAPSRLALFIPEQGPLFSTPPNTPPTPGARGFDPWYDPFSRSSFFSGLPKLYASLLCQMGDGLLCFGGETFYHCPSVTIVFARPLGVLGGSPFSPGPAPDYGFFFFCIADRGHFIRGKLVLFAKRPFFSKMRSLP